MKRLGAGALSLVLMLTLLARCREPLQERKAETWSFTDSCGRTVALPREVNKIVPSGPLAQIVLYTLCPDRLQSLSTPLTRTQKKYIDETYWDLPVTGQFYGGGSTVNYENIAAAAPDIIIDIGEAKEGIAEDMDELQEKCGVPAIFIEAGISTMADAYETLGQVTGAAEQAAACVDYIRETLDDSERFSALIPEGARKRVLYAQGEFGTEVLGEGSIHAEVLEYAAADNIAKLSVLPSKGGNVVSMEQIFLWDPEVLILSPEANYDEIFEDPLWSEVRAVRTGEVYEVPNGPYNWMDRPPSVQRILTVKWLGNLLYPEVFNYDMAAEAQKFYHLFFHYELSEDEARELMQSSTYKSP